MSQIAVGPQVSQVCTAGGPVLLANQDLVNPVTVCTQKTFSQDATNTDVIPPLGSIAYGPRGALYALAPAGTAGLLVIAGGTSWAPSPAQVALQIATLGLAQDSTLQAVKTSTANALTAGVPPAVPGVASASQLFGTPAGSPYTLFTFGANGRLWGASLAVSVGTNASYSPTGNTNLYAQLKTGSGIVLEVVEAVINGASQQSGDHGDMPLAGIKVNSGDTLILDVNNGASITNAEIRASGFVLYSVP